MFLNTDTFNYGGHSIVLSELSALQRVDYRRASGHVSDRCLFGLHHFTCRGYQRFSEGSWAVHHVCFRLAAGDGFPVGEQLHKLTGFPVSFV